MGILASRFAISLNGQGDCSGIRTFLLDVGSVNDRMAFSSVINMLVVVVYDMEALWDVESLSPLGPVDNAAFFLCSNLSKHLDVSVSLRVP